MRVHHVGYLVQKLHEAEAAFQDLGYTSKGEVIRDESRGADIVFLVSGQTCVELISPTDDTSPLKPLLKRYTNSPYHICYEADNFLKDCLYLEEQGFTMFNPPAPAPALGGRRVAFFMHANAGMIELLEEKPCH